MHFTTVPHSQGDEALLRPEKKQVWDAVQENSVGIGKFNRPEM
jgi:hypothetical protein